MYVRMYVRSCYYSTYILYTSTNCSAVGTPPHTHIQYVHTDIRTYIHATMLSHTLHTCGPYCGWCLKTSAPPPYLGPSLSLTVHPTVMSLLGRSLKEVDIVPLVSLDGRRPLEKEEQRGRGGERRGEQGGGEMRGGRARREGGRMRRGEEGRGMRKKEKGRGMRKKEEGRGTRREEGRGREIGEGVGKKKGRGGRGEIERDGGGEMEG